jgi:hypothetical protein
LVSEAGLQHAKDLVTAYKQGQIQSMTPEIWQAKKIIDSTLHPGGLQLSNAMSKGLGSHCEG